MTSNKHSQRKRIAFRVDFDHATGGGHLQRCLALAKAAQQRQLEPFFLVKGEESLLGNLLHGFDSIFLPKDSALESEFAYWESRLDPSSIAAFFFDISHARTYANLPALPLYAARMRRHSIRTAVIDGMMPDSILQTGQDPETDFLITPYVGAEKSNGSFSHLFGPEYFVLRPEILGFRPTEKKAIPQARRILISMGRSDPGNSTAAVLEAAAQEALPGKEISVVVGDLFSTSAKAHLQEMAAGLQGVKLLLAPSDISAQLAQADLALVGAGLTKYELAFVGTPGIFFSSSEMMHEINLRFASYGSGIAMGPLDKLSAEAIRLKLNELAADPAARSAMAQAGLGLIDGQGAERILRSVLGQSK